MMYMSASISQSPKLISILDTFLDKCSRTYTIRRNIPLTKDDDSHVYLFKQYNKSEPYFFDMFKLSSGKILPIVDSYPTKAVRMIKMISVKVITT